MNPFVIARDPHSRDVNAQGQLCRREKMPLVQIWMRRRYARAEIDMDPTTRGLDDEAMERICAALREPTTVGKVICAAERVPKESAEEVARRIFNIAVEALPRLRSWANPSDPEETREGDSSPR